MYTHRLTWAVMGSWLVIAPFASVSAQSHEVLLARGSTSQPSLAADSISSARTPAPVPDAPRQVDTYAEIAFRVYRDAHAGAQALGRAVDRLLRTPNASTLSAARKAWIAARPSYGRSEAFRFYGGPIDAHKAGATAALQSSINAWPLNEAYIDGVIAGHEWITESLLIRMHAHDDEADVTTGYHAIEYLLWGQDTRADGPGDRKASDFVGEGAASRRRTYLKVTSDMLTEQLRTLVDAWAPGKDNYRALMQHQPSATSLRNMLLGLATLSVDLATARLTAALASSSPETEQSCFSDNTHMDILANVLGIQSVYMGHYASYQGAGLHTLLQTADRELSRKLQTSIGLTVQLAQHIDRPLDRTLASAPGSAGRAKLEALVQALQTQSELFKQAAVAFGVKELTL